MPSRSARNVRSETQLTAREAAELLGIKLPTLYAYVSRGLVRSIPGPKGRARRYRRDDVERLRARRARVRRPASPLSWGDPVLESGITRMTHEGPVYRGVPLADLVGDEVAFERVAELLWSADGSERADPEAWSPPDLGVDIAAVAQLIPAGTTPLAGLQLLVPALALRDPGRFDWRRESVLPRARRLLRRIAAGLALTTASRDAVPERVAASLAAPTLAEATAAALGARGATAWRAIQTALVVCADHELNASTFTARVAASTRADLYAVIGAALCALSGPLHGSVSEQVEALLEEIGEPENAERVIHERLRRGEHVPGFGHPYYRDGDPRAQMLLAAAGLEDSRTRPARALLALLRAAEASQRPPPNLDVGLVAVTAPLGSSRGAAAGLFAVGRAAGWVAHGLEQIETGHLLRPRARYAGDDPVDGRGMLD